MDISFIRENYDCDYDTGEVFRILKGGRRRKSGTKCNGYIRSRVNGRMVYNHRLVWAHYYLSNPPECIDHINGDRTDNSIKNLRASNPSHNQINRKLSKNNTTGYPGVSLHKKSGKYKSTIYIDYEPVHLGLYETAEEAFKAYKERKVVEEQRRNAMV